MHSLKKRLSVILVLLMLFSVCLVGCDNREKPVEAQENFTQNDLLHIMKRSLDSDLAQVIRAEDWVVHDGRLWACGSGEGAYTDGEAKRFLLASANTDGTAVTTLPLELLPDPALIQQKNALENENPEIDYQLFLTAEKLLFDYAGSPYVVLQEVLVGYINGGIENQVEARQFTLCAIDADGVPQRLFQLQLPQDYLPVDYVFTDNGTLWVYMDGTQWQDLWQNGTLVMVPFPGCCLRFSVPSGECTARVDLPGSWYATYGQHIYKNLMVRQKNGSLLLSAINDGRKYSLFSIDDPAAAQPAISEPLPVKTTNKTLEGFIPIVNDPFEEDVFIKTNEGIILCDSKTGECQQILEWGTYGIVQEVDPTQAVFCCAKTELPQFLRINSEGALQMLSTLDEKEMAKLPVVTVAVVNSELKQAAYAYNAGGHDYYVRAIDYGFEAAITAGFSSSAEMLNHAVITGSAPDILLTDGTLNPTNLARKGLFLDLYPYIDADPEMARDDFVSGVLSATELNGALPTVTLSYTVMTAVGDSDVLGADMGWIWEQYNALTAQYPNAVPFYQIDRNSMLLYLLHMGGDKLIDRSAGKAHLDSPDFVRLLQLSADYPESITTPGESGTGEGPKELFAQRKALMRVEYLNNFYSILSAEYEFDGPVTYKGFPNDAGGGSGFQPKVQVGINSRCENPDAAWDVVRTLLLPEYQQTIKMGFPLRWDALRAAAEFARQPAEQYVPVPSYLPNPLTAGQKEYFYQGISAAQGQQILDLIQTTDTMYWYDKHIAAILAEEAEAFYNGQCTAAQAAAIMQNRVQTYLDEQG